MRILGGAVCVLLGVIVWQERKLRRLRTERASAAEQALLGRVRINGRDFPLPSAEWTFETTKINGREAPILRHGVAVVDNVDLFVRIPNAASPALPRSSDTAAYVAEVWRCYHNRLLREDAK